MKVDTLPCSETDPGEEASLEKDGNGYFNVYYSATNEYKLEFKKTPVPEGSYEVQIKGKAMFTMHRGIDGLTPTIRVKIKDLATAEYVRLSVKVKDPNDLIMNIPQDRTVCSGADCPALLEHVLEPGQFNINSAEAVKDFDILSEKWCALCVDTYHGFSANSVPEGSDLASKVLP